MTKHPPPYPFHSHPAGDFNSITDTLGGFKCRRRTDPCFNAFCPHFFKITRKISSFVQYQRKNFFTLKESLFCLSGNHVAVKRVKSRCSEGERSTGQTGKFHFALTRLWMWDGLRLCWSYLAGSFENYFLLRIHQPHLHCSSLSQTFLQKGKNLEQPWSCMVKHLTRLSESIIHLQHFDAAGGIENMLWEQGDSTSNLSELLSCMSMYTQTMFL